MTSFRSTFRLPLPWLLLAPVLVLAGVGLGRFLPSAKPISRTQWRDSDALDRRPLSRSGAGSGAESAAGTMAGPSSSASLPRQVGMPSLAPIVARVGAGVVGIRTIHKQLSRGEVGSRQAGRGPELRAVDAELQDPTAALGSDASSVRQASDGVTLGTGFLIHRDGLILTALHVVADPMVIVVRIEGHRQMQAELIGEDPSTDLAVIRLIAPPQDLQVLELGDSEFVRQGDWVMTLGNPLNFEHSVGVGVVSHVARHIQQDGYGITNGYLQFTAPSNPGSSGSPVFDMNGEVVGIATRGALSAQGLSFAIPSRVVRQVLRAMERNGGQVRRAYLGIAFKNLDRPSPDSADVGEFASGSDPELGVSVGKRRTGVRVSGVTPGDPAHRAGLRKGDIIVAFDDRPVLNSQDLYEWITWSVPQTKVHLDVVREGSRLDSFEVELGEIGEPVSSDPSH